LNEFLDSAQRIEFDTYPGTPARLKAFTAPPSVVKDGTAIGTVG